MDIKCFRYRYNLLLGMFVAMASLCSCGYSSLKTDYPLEFKYASVSIDYDGMADTLKNEMADSIMSCIARAGFVVSDVDGLKEEQRDSLLFVTANLTQSGASLHIAMSFYPYGGNVFSEVYFSRIKKDDAIAEIKVESCVPFSPGYNRRKAFEMLNNGFITEGGVRDIFNYYGNVRQP